MTGTGTSCSQSSNSASKSLCVPGAIPPTRGIFTATVLSPGTLMVCRHWKSPHMPASQNLPCVIARPGLR